MLRLAALDAEDLAIISAHMQDAVLLVGDIAFRPRAGQFALVANRFAWDAQDRRQRRRTGLHFDRVQSVSSQNIRRDDKTAVLSLLAIRFVETEGPAGEVILDFSGGGAIRLGVECLEAQLKDLGPAWEARGQPHHPVAEDGGP